MNRSTCTFCGTRISYLDSLIGNKTIIILHGFSFSSKLYFRLGVLLVNKGYRVIIPDLPGHGQSEPMGPNISLTDTADLLFELVETVVGPEKKITIIGHSMGGLVGIYFAKKNAELINRLILLNSSGLAFINRNIFGWIFAAIKKTFRGYKTPGATLKILCEVTKNLLTHPQYLLRTADVVINCLVWPEELACPVSVFCASNDDIYPPHSVDIQTKYIAVEQSHDWPVLNPDDVVKTIANVL